VRNVAAFPMQMPMRDRSLQGDCKRPMRNFQIPQPDKLKDGKENQGWSSANAYLGTLPRRASCSNACDVGDDKSLQDALFV